ncbi:MAG: ATP-binding cassette domain-containing protein, partial [Deltaproteobacteria bacterium]|nr:ATP-binding cassette domain-containing protein [Deltaproteobacteria bacterium]
MIIQAVDVTKVYESRGVLTRALDGVCLGLEAGEFCALAGPSGSGKTTLLNLLGALDAPTSGKIQIEGVELSELSPAQLSDLRLHKLGFVFQAYNLIPVLTARENVEFVMELQNISNKERRDRAMAVLERVGLAGL